MTDQQRIAEITARCEAATKHLAEHKAGGWEAHYSRDMSTALAEIDRLTERWIPVTERLPEDDHTMKMHKESHMEFCSVLAVGVFRGCEYANPTVSMVNRIRLKKTGIEYIDREMKTEDWHWSAPFESVTHWQPLPAAPEKGAKHERD